MKTFKIITYGCTLNHADSFRIRTVMLDNGWTESDDPDIIILNTCGVKHATEQKILYRLEKYHHQNKKVIVTGCLAHNVKLILNTNPDVSILGVRSLSLFPSTADKMLNDEKVISLQGKGKENIIPSPLPGTVIHPVTLQEGCMNNCTYCFTKFARPILISYPLKNIRWEVEQAVRQGVKEIQLTGQDTGAYHYDGKNVADVLKEICSVDGEFKVRLGMINPEHVLRLFDNLVLSYNHEKMYKFIHVPIQSGSDDVLSHMKRRYTVEEFVSIIRKIRNIFNDITIATDMIVGYPTETESDFQKSLDVIRELRFDIVNVSMFSPRPFTEAAKLKKLTSQVVKTRSKIMSKLVNSITIDNNKKYIGKSLKILITEKGNIDRQVKGRTDSYKEVIVNQPIKLGSWVNVKITDITQTSLVGKVL
ncbi:tRNA (N(6)-L-threonylcarbamoyladenosine(37)-C(2))-methylthiotransferase [Candidatus Micrarchaeota archaeon]|nr:tRNA (N(6)-L-threonylcarbamoyladenosine(37)-C(2))-methylthiotransferase [Candidatus Micrarchaeota archaeon]